MTQRSIFYKSSSKCKQDSGTVERTVIMVESRTLDEAQLCSGDHINCWAQLVNQNGGSGYSAIFRHDDARHAFPPTASCEAYC